MSHTMLINTKVHIQSTLGSAKTITAISKASEASVTVSHDFSAGDYVVFDATTVGMTEINERAVRILSVTGTSAFVAEALDSSGYSTYVSGGTVKKVTAFIAFDNATTFNFPEPEPTRLNATTIHDTESVEVFGMDAPVAASMAVNADPMGTTMVAVRAAALAKTTRVLKVTLQTGVILLFNARIAGGRGLEGSAGAIATGNVSLALAKREQYFAS